MGVQIGYGFEPTPNLGPIPYKIGVDDYRPGGLGGLGGITPQPKQSFLQGDNFGNILQAVGSSLMASPRNAPLAGFGNALQGAQRDSALRQEQRQQQAAMGSTKKWLIDQGISEAEADAAIANPSIMAALFKKMQGAEKMAPVNLGDGFLYFPDTGETINAKGNAAGASSGAFRFGGNSVEAQALNGLMDSGQLTPEQAQQLAAGKTITNPQDGSVVFLTPQGVFGQQAGSAPTPVSPGSVSAPSVDGASSTEPGARSGIIPLTEGKPGKLATEGERRNRSLYSVVEPELKIVEENFSALSDLSNQVGSKAWGADKYLTTPEYQRASNSLRTIIASYLYSVSGATATPQEIDNQAAILTPKIGEDPLSVADKLQRVRTMVGAIKSAGGEPAPNGGTADPLGIR